MCTLHMQMLRGAEGNQQVTGHLNCHCLPAWTDMPLEGSTKKACPLLLVVSILALFVAVGPLLLGGRARL